MMIFISPKWLLLLFLLLNWVMAAPQSSCSTVAIRKEWRQLTLAEQANFFTGIRLLMEKSNDLDSAYEHFSRQHLDNAAWAHNSAVFFPWHRYFVRQVEVSIQKILQNTSFAMPYWDWTIDSQAPEQSPLLTPQAFGTLGDINQNACVTNGVLANLTRHVPTLGCLTRSNASIIGAFYSAQQIQVMMAHSSNYDTFRRDMEDLPHAVVHMNLGGDMATMYSPNDPLFYLHHSQMDRLWAEWQGLTEQNAMDYGGVQVDPVTSQTFQVALTDVMVPFDVPVSHVMDSNVLCYRYSSTSTPSLSKNTVNQLVSFIRQPHASSFTLADTLFAPIDMLLDPFDRSKDHQGLLRMAQPLTAEWIKTRNMNMTGVRQREHQFSMINFRINRMNRV